MNNACKERNQVRKTNTEARQTRTKTHETNDKTRKARNKVRKAKTKTRQIKNKSGTNKSHNTSIAVNTPIKRDKQELSQQKLRRTHARQKNHALAINQAVIIAQDRQGTKANALDKNTTQQ